jgi:rRNA pseudouridine-1189 N-methylase Emg1 (Nep1/Mra1 family)
MLQKKKRDLSDARPDVVHQVGLSVLFGDNADKAQQLTHTQTHSVY